MTAAFLAELEQVFAWLLAASWQASVLTVLVLLVQRILGARLNPRWRYALWLLVLLRLLLPVEPESTLSLFQFAPAPTALTVTVTEPLFVSQPIPALPSAPADAPDPTRSITFYSLLAVIWLAGALILLVLTWQVNRRFARHVANSPAISDPELLRLFAKAKTELGIHRSIKLIESGHVRSPAIMGLFQPTLLLPADVRKKFDARELRFIFLHELAHLKRGDVMAQALIALLQIFHWFNPVLWFAFRRMRIDREPATDALVLSRTGVAEKEHYGLMLIKLLEHFNQRHSLPTLVGILEDKDQFKRRFTLIASFTRGAYGWSLLGLVVVALLSVVCLTKVKAQDKPSKAAKYLELDFVEEPGALNGVRGRGQRNAEDIAQLLNGPKNKVAVMSDVALKDGPISLKGQTPAGFSVTVTGEWKTAIKAPQKVGYRIDETPVPTAIGTMMAASWETKDILSEDTPIVIFQSWKPESHANVIIRIVDQPTSTKSIGFYPFSRIGEVPPSVSASDAEAMKSLKLSNWRVDDMPMNDFLPALSKRLKEEDGADVSFVLMVSAENSPYPVTFHIPTGTDLASLLDLLNKRFPIRYKYRGPGDIVIWQVSHFETAFDQKAEDTKIDLDLDNVAPADALGKIQEASAKAGFAFYDGNLDPYHRLQPTPTITMHVRGMKLAEAFHQFMVATNTRLFYDGERFCLSTPVGDLPLAAEQAVDSSFPRDSDGHSPDASANPTAASTSETLAQLVLALHDSAKSIPADHQGLQILKGFYGADGSWKDVTGILQKSVQNNSLKVSWQQPYTEIGGDPAYLQVKTLVVSYRFDGVEKLATFREENPPVGLQAIIPATPASTLNEPAVPAPSSGNALPNPPDASPKDTAAIVNGHVITTEELKNQWQVTEDNLRANYSGKELQEQLVLAGRRLMRALIDRWLIIDAFKAQSIYIQKPYTDERIDDIVRHQFGGDRAAFLQTLAQRGQTLDSYREQIEDNAIVGYMRNKFMEPKLEEYYQSHFDLFPSDEFLRITTMVIKGSVPVLVGNIGDVAAESDPRATLAREVHRKMQAGEDVSSIIPTEGTDPDYVGKSRWVTQERFPSWWPITWGDVEKLKPGETTAVAVSDGFFSSPGRPEQNYHFYYIVRLEERRPAKIAATAETTKEDKAVLEVERQRLQNEWLGPLREKAKIQVFDAARTIDPWASEAPHAMPLNPQVPTY